MFIFISRLRVCTCKKIHREAMRAVPPSMLGSREEEGAGWGGGGDGEEAGEVTLMAMLISLWLAEHLGGAGPNVLQFTATCHV